MNLFGDGYELAVELVDGRVESDAHGLRLAARDTVERVTDTAVIWVEADIRKDDRFAAGTFGGYERAVQCVEVPTQIGPDVGGLVADGLKQAIALATAEDEGVNAMLHYVAKIDVVAASCDRVEVCAFCEAGIIDLVGVYVG